MNCFADALNNFLTKRLSLFLKIEYICTIFKIIVMEFDMFAYVWLPLMIFFARICDVTIGTLRIILVSKGHKYLAPALGFVKF